MKRIIELFERDFTTPPEEIIKVNNELEDVVYSEITEYVATDRIKDHYRHLLKEMADAPSHPTEGIGVWVSGFFGSGKSSFIKNLGYVLANRQVKGRSVSDLFAKQLKDKRIEEYVDYLNKSIPYEVFMFDVQVDLNIQTNAEQIAEIMYRVLLRQLDYADDYFIAELEVELESEGKLDDLRKACQKRFKEEWRKIRKGAQMYARTSALMQELDPKTYPNEDSWQKAKTAPRLTVGDIVERCFDLCDRRRKGKSICFIVDEMGQYVARSSEKLENLRAVVEQFGKVGLQRFKRGDIKGPAWIIVTSQEKLQEVYDYVKSGRIDLPKLQDRFRHLVDLSPADIREVASKRILSKKEEAMRELEKLFSKQEGTLLANSALERSGYNTNFTEEDFVLFYPYFPHFIDLSIDIMSGIRQHGMAPRHLGGSNRTIIRQAYEMLVSDRTKLGEKPIGALVTIDKIYELVEGNMPSEKQKSVNDIQQAFSKDREYKDLAVRVAKAVCLMEFAPNKLARTTRNIATLLVEHVGDPVHITAVEAILSKLKDLRFVREAEDGWKLQTEEEKRWEEEKGRLMQIKRAERNEILRKYMKEVFDDARVRNLNYKNLRTFSPSLSLDDQPIPPSGQIPLHLISVDESEDFATRLSQTATDSLQDANRNKTLWVFQIQEEVEKQIAALSASTQMIFKYDNLKSQGKTSGQELASLQSEKTEKVEIEKKLLKGLTRSVQQGTGFFRGIKLEAGDLGKDLGEIARNLLMRAIPDMYPKLELGNRHLDGDEVDRIFKEANLQNLPAVFHGGEGLNLVTTEGNRYVLNSNAESAREILDYLKAQHQFGNKITGKQIAEHFGDFGYGWDQDVIRLVLATLFRSGSIDVTHQGRTYRNYQEPLARLPFTNTPAFRNAAFAPRETIDLKTLTTAVRNLEAMIGQEVDVEEGAIAESFRKLADVEKEKLLPALATARAHRLPFTGLLEEWRETLETVTTGASDDCVRLLSGQGKTIQSLRDTANQIEKFLNDENLEKIRMYRRATDSLPPALRLAGEEGRVQDAVSELKAILESPDITSVFKDAGRLANSIAAVYREVYEGLHKRRFESYDKAIQEIQGMPEFLQLKDVEAETVLEPLRRRAIEEIDLPPFAEADRTTGATLAVLNTDLDALPGLVNTAKRRIQEIVAAAGGSEEDIARVQLASFFTGPKDPEKSEIENVKASIERLQEYLFNLLEQGKKIIWE
ncbi:BREX system P-loop protein BrxC [bacterium]|nr:BREX system P-loop protein BrxC [bacterium]